MRRRGPWRTLTAILLMATAAAADSPAPDGPDRHPRQPGAAPDRLLVAAAASLSGLAPDLARAFHEESGGDVRFTFGGSNTLARQIVEGARLDVFFSADEAQMDVVEAAGRVVAGTRVDVLSNRLVVIVPADSGLAEGTAEMLGSGAVRRVAMGDPAAVPAGVYGRQWLEAVRLWPAVRAKVVPLPSSPAALAAVRAGRAEAGIVYATDARGQSGVRVAHIVAEGEGPRIVYPAAAIRGGRARPAVAFLEFVRGPVASQIFRDAGFLISRRVPRKGAGRNFTFCDPCPVAQAESEITPGPFVEKCLTTR
ncbi:MAG: molybdate ABC transporter substrate-binding protein [Acidobacteriota bacterium]